MIVKTERAERWEEAAARTAKRFWTGPPCRGPVSVTMWIAFADRRKRDAPNVEEGILDALEGVCYEDDCQVFEWHGYKAVMPDLDRHELYVHIQPLGANDGST